MISRYIIRCMAPRVFKLHSSAVAVRNTKPIVKNSSQSSSLFSSNTQTRFYSKEANASVVDYDYVKTATSQNAVMIVDVREPDEVKEHGKIPNSVNIPLGSISTSLEMSDKEFLQTYNRAKPNKNAEIIFYCMIGKRSGKAQQNALNLGFKNAKNYLGSWTDWAAKNQ